ncbi:MAG: hypothetical protein HKN03_08445 [Acidimicrobiales bacterium]|nr:hypothetical protein [Acidimicrobiales bacterium]
MNQRSAVAVLAFLLMAVAFLTWRVLALRSTAVAPPSPSPTTESSVTAAEAFVSAWTKDQQATYVATATVGLRGDGVKSETEEVRARRHGQLMINRDSTIYYQHDGVTETCRQTPSEIFCTPPASTPTFSEQLNELNDLLIETGRRYRTTLSEDPGCFDFELDRSQGPATTLFGQAATYCFDPDGVLVSTLIQRQNREDFVEVSDVATTGLESALTGLFPEPIIEQFLSAP